MALTFSVTRSPADRVRAELLAVPVGPAGALGPGADAVDAALGGGLAAFVEEAGFEGKPGQTLAVPVAGRLGASAALLVGVGDVGLLTTEGLRQAAAAVARRASKVASLATTLVDASPTLDRGDAARAVAEGMVLGTYRFLPYKSDAEPSRLRRVAIVTEQGSGIAAALERGRVVADAVCWARDMVNEPAGGQSPADFVAAARRRLAGRGVTTTVLTGAQLRAARMGGVLGVGQGSDRPPRFLRVSYRPAGRRTGRLALVGKGVVFDSGGLSLKPPDSMESMKTDMSGAAAVVAAMSVLRDVGVRAEVTAYVPLVENMPSGAAIRPGDVLRMRSGTTVEVLNTDAEGRLILADALSWAVDERADAIVDLATLTGACVVALGEHVAGLMANHDGWWAQVRAAADRAGEAVWPLPLPEEYRRLIDSDVADVKNTGPRWGGALTAGIFLQRFVDDAPWAHLDIAGPARTSSENDHTRRGGTGFGVRTLVELAATFRRPEGRAEPIGRPRGGGRRGSSRRTA